MAAEERTYLSCESENNLNKFYEDDAYKSRHYKKRFLLGYTQRDLNETAREMHGENTLAYNEPSIKLVDLTRLKTDPYNSFYDDSNNLFIRRSEKRKLASCDLNAEESSNNHLPKVNRIEGDLQYGAEGISQQFYTRLEGASCSMIDIRHSGHIDDEVPLNLAINKRLPAPEDTWKESLPNAEVQSAETNEEPTLTDYTLQKITQ